MNDQNIHDLSEVIRSNPEDAAAYLNRGYAYFQKGDDDKAIENFDSTVRICSNYETDFIDSNFVHGGKEAVEAAIELLNSRVNTPPESATDFYYTGVEALFHNNKMTAWRAFKMALELGYEDQTKIKRHLENLKHRK